jgi:hypothetical protein
MKRCVALLSICLATSAFPSTAAIELRPDGYHVHPGDEIQDALQQAATNRTQKVVIVHAGEYRPSRKRQALIWFNRIHDGLHLRAEGAVTLTAANPKLAQPAETGFPAVVNHVVYFGDGISSNTVVEGFRLTGANNFITKENTREMEPSRFVLRNHFFYSDGGAVKVFGRSYPILRNLEIVDNYSSPCGGGISVQHQGFKTNSVLIQDCVFRRNRAQGTGSALDLLAGSSARIVNCLFVENSSNEGEDPVAKASGERPFVNNGVLTVFWRSSALVRNCTFTGNRNGVDDMGGESSYTDCVFVENKLERGLKGFPRYELAINAGARVVGCVINGTVHDLRQNISPSENVLNAPPPEFDSQFVPRAPLYRKAGYRPIGAANVAR